MEVNVPRHLATVGLIYVSVERVVRRMADLDAMIASGKRNGTAMHDLTKRAHHAIVHPEGGIGDATVDPEPGGGARRWRGGTGASEQDSDQRAFHLHGALPGAAAALA